MLSLTDLRFLGLGLELVLDMNFLLGISLGTNPTAGTPNIFGEVAKIPFIPFLKAFKKSPRHYSNEVVSLCILFSSALRHCRLSFCRATVARATVLLPS